MKSWIHQPTELPRKRSELHVERNSRDEKCCRQGLESQNIVCHSRDEGCGRAATALDGLLNIGIPILPHTHTRDRTLGKEFHVAVCGRMTHGNGR